MEIVNFFLIAFSFFQTITIEALPIEEINTDQSALLSFKSSFISGSTSILTKNWTTDTSFCTWSGVTCGLRHPRVTGLNLSSMSLGGTIPPQLGNLSFLASIDLSNNGFHGSLPEDLVKLHRLRVLKLSDNDLSGNIPSWIGNLSNLEVLSFSNNSFTGSIPRSLYNLTKLEDLLMFSNELEGVIPDMFDNFDKLRIFYMHINKLTGVIPYTLFGLSSIQAISLGNNNLTGILRDDMCNNSTQNLEKIYLYQNNFHGDLQGKFQNCYALLALALEGNNFSGRIPRELGNLTSLVAIDFNTNQLTGEIPEELGQLYNLKNISLHSNGLKGPIPLGIFNLSGLSTLVLEYNQLTGNLPSAMGQGLSNLETLFLRYNNLGGPIPESISNCSILKEVDISHNEFTGFIPHSLGDLSLLQYLFIHFNNLTSDKSLTFITSLTKCIYLIFLDFSSNPMNGVLPSSVGNLSSFLMVFSAENAMIKGNLPMEFGNMSSLILLGLPKNQISGSFPESFTGSLNLQRLYLNNNLMDGSLTSSLCDLMRLGGLYLSSNRFTGAIPNCLGNITTLRYLYLDGNKLSSIIPETLWELKDVMNLSLSSNNLSGPLSPQIGNLKSMLLLDVSFNQLSGGIPTTIGGLTNLIYLSLANNCVPGLIPDSFGGMFSLGYLNLSHNNLSGLIPKSLEMLRFLQELDVSFNHLKGEIPSGGRFNDFTDQSFLFNDALCSNKTKYKVPKCPPSSRHHTSRKRSILCATLIALGGVSLLAMASAVFLLRCTKRNNVLKRQELQVSILPGRISYYELIQATNRFNESNWLGSGSYGSVYKGVFKDGTLVAVKHFDIHGEEDAFKSFDRECEVLRHLRHRNLTKVIGSCSNVDFKAIVLEYMPSGSLEKQLYAHNYSLSIERRLEIMLDVACALEYLHHGCLTPVVHCDIKPSNVLLDENMVAHVSDFGISKLLYEGNSIEHTNTLATFGYIAPEYGLEGLISTRCDVYSYGIMLMEVFTRLKPTDEILFGGDNSLKSWVKDNVTINVVDNNLLKPNENHFEEKLKCVSTIFDLALGCCADSPTDRLNMKQVVAMLQGIKVQFKTYFGETSSSSIDIIIRR